MSDGKPILFNGPMVRAILAGRKTQTRRVLKPQPVMGCNNYFVWHTKGVAIPLKIEYWVKENLPYAPGDHLWVRETWSGEHWLRNVEPSERMGVANPERLVPLAPEIWYWADGSPESGDWEKPRPPTHMPRWASRITLLVTDVRVQRVQDITPADAIAEGIAPSANSETIDCDTLNPKDGFHVLWESIYGPGAWGRNDWVAAYTFKRIMP